MRIPLDLPPGLMGGDTTFAAAGRWSDGSNIRFHRGRPQVIGGWERLTETALAGVCRNAFGWTNTSGDLSFAFGTHAGLEIWTGGALFTITPTGLAPGLVDGTGGGGFGTGAFSTGGYSEPSQSEYLPRTWALAAWGRTLVASPRGGRLYAWENAPASPAAPVANAPAKISHMLVAPTDQVFALGCNEEVSGDFNPLCIRHSGVRALTEWATGPETTAREYILPGGGRIVAGRVIGAHLLVWTNHALFLGSFLGALEQPWRFEQVGDRCGLIGPNAAVTAGQAAYWLGPDLQFYRYVLGGAVEPLPCPLREDMAAHLPASQAEKITASTISAFSEVRFDYPDDRDGAENSRYLLFSRAEGVWSRGRMARSAFVDAGPAEHPVGVDPAGAVYWHERGASADGGAFGWFIETADTYLSEDAVSVLLGVWPDIQDQIGAVALHALARFHPQGDEAVQGPVALTPSQDKADLRITGRLFRLRFSGTAAPTFCRLGRPVFEMAPAGKR